jgi:predicted transcriptional regulator
MFLQKSNHTRLNSCIPVTYNTSMDEVDFFIEDILSRPDYRVEKTVSDSLIEKILVSHDFSVAKQRTEDAEYYRELLSRFIKTYGN